MRELAEREGIDLAASYAYSDSESDLPMLRAVGQPVVVNPDAAAAADRRRGRLGGDRSSTASVRRLKMLAALGAGRAGVGRAGLGERRCAGAALARACGRPASVARRATGGGRGATALTACEHAIAECRACRTDTRARSASSSPSPGLDGHDRGAKIIARALRDAGMEVIYTGLHQTPEQIVETVIQEDADAVGLSILSGAHMTLVPRVVELLREQGIDDVVVTVGGTIPAEDIPELKGLGVAEVFTPGAPTQAIVDFIRERHRGGRAAD